MGFFHFYPDGALVAGLDVECAAIVIAGLRTRAGEGIKTAKPYHLVNQETTCQQAPSRCFQRHHFLP